ncbi:YeeE/YedE thiosulfate transporter family protein [Thalassospiraceae bacterium LMO-SO8]|nr:YeeE/YedE family protein [Alphaproteobacteria bacterium LMO-S08]WND75241.1 YeeE/YedE thiosulfate transporter family protein [Thalassospiraceae bacterium LMO-SO8]
MTTLILAIVIGGAFGFVLDRIGATNPNVIIGMLRLSNLHLAKTIFLAIGAASVLLYAGLMLGIVDPGHLDVKDAYWGVFIGGLLLGLGFALSGYCPGTGLAAAATGRWDGVVFVLGGLVGAAAYMATYAWVKSTGALDHVLGGKATLGPLSGTSYPAMLDGISGEWVGLALGVAFIAVAALLPGRLRAGPPRAD